MSARTSSPSALPLLAADGLLFVSTLRFAAAPASRHGASARTGLGLAGLLAAVPASHLTLTAAAGSVVTLGLALVVAGTIIVPTCAIAYAVLDAAAPTGTVTEAFAWMTTAVALGTSGGAAAAAAGALARRRGPCALLRAGRRRRSSRHRRRPARPHRDSRCRRRAARQNECESWRAPLSGSTANAAAVGTR